MSAPCVMPCACAPQLTMTLTSLIKSAASGETVIELARRERNTSSSENCEGEGKIVAEEQTQTKLQVGDVAPELNFMTADGGERKLSEVWKDGPALVLWLRHLG
jgi:hypothetical protein